MSTLEARTTTTATLGPAETAVALIAMPFYLIAIAIAWLAARAGVR